MLNFDYNIPTRVHFGKGQISKLKEEVLGFGNRILLVYGGGSIKKTGLYDTVTELLTQAGAQITELNGVEPNPKIESVRDGVHFCRQQQIQVVLAVGGGSVIDCAKVIAAGAYYDGDPWDLVTDPDKITKALPLVTVLTLSATGSEMDNFAVISNMAAHEKLGTGSELLRPRASILDPEYTYTVSPRQTAAGTADIMSHIFEVYFTRVNGAFVQARFCEGLLKTCIRYGKLAMEEPKNYEARANLMWASSLAINDLLSYGAAMAWSVHPMEHELSAFYDITHGEGLAILTPNWMEYIQNDKTIGRLAMYGINVWGIDESLKPHVIAKMAIANTRKFFQGLGLPSTLRQVGIDESNLKIMAEKAVKTGGLENAYVPLTTNDVLNIFRMSL